MTTSTTEAVDEPCKLLEWDSQFFGFRIAAVTARQLDGLASSRILAWAQANRIRCLYCLREASDDAAVRLLGAAGFFSVDTRLTFERSLPADGTAPHTDGSRSVRQLRPEDLPALLEIAGAAHQNTRFFSDPNFPRFSASELYRQWLQRDINDPQTSVLVAEREDLPVGYLSWRLNAVKGASISLLGLDPGSRGRGLGRALVRAAVNQALEKGVGRVITVTQGTNLAARRVYAAEGFCLVNQQIWLHRWFDSS